jgi:hypothetical protein
VHKTNYLGSWDHELPEEYYPLSLSEYEFLLGGSGFKTITTVKTYPELEGIEELSKSIQLYDPSSNSNLLDLPCNCLLIAKKM